MWQFYKATARPHTNAKLETGMQLDFASRTELKMLKSNLTSNNENISMPFTQIQY
jgi:hypothetical protein